MYTSQPLANRYRETAIKTANPLQLVVILYDAAIQALQEAQEHLRTHNIASRARCINRAVAVLSELQASLNLKEGGTIADSLDRLYTYMKQRVFVANLEQKPEPLSEVVSLLGGLRSAWGELAVRSQTSANEAQIPAPSVQAGMLQDGSQMNSGMGSLSVCG